MVGGEEKHMKKKRKGATNWERSTRANGASACLSNSYAHAAGPHRPGRGPRWPPGDPS